jgi:hypothetical protein
LKNNPIYRGYENIKIKLSNDDKQKLWISNLMNDVNLGGGRLQTDAKSLVELAVESKQFGML